MLRAELPELAGLAPLRRLAGAPGAPAGERRPPHRAPGGAREPGLDHPRGGRASEGAGRECRLSSWLGFRIGRVVEQALCLVICRLSNLVFSESDEFSYGMDESLNHNFPPGRIAGVTRPGLYLRLTRRVIFSKP